MKPKADLRFPHEAGWTALAEIGGIPEKPSNRDCFRRLLSVLVCPTLLTSNSFFQRRANNETLPCACGSGWRPQKIRCNHDRDVDNDHVRHPRGPGHRTVAGAAMKRFLLPLLLVIASAAHAKTALWWTTTTSPQ